MFRILTRGFKEKIQLKNTRTATYPQSGFVEGLVPTPAKLLNKKGQIIAFRNTSFTYPITYNGFRVPQFNQTQRIITPYNNLGFNSGGGLNVFDYGRRGGYQLNNPSRNVSFVRGRGEFFIFPYTHTIFSVFSEISYKETALLYNFTTNISGVARIIANRMPAMNSAFKFSPFAPLINPPFDQLLVNEFSQGSVNEGVCIGRANVSYQYTRINKKSVYLSSDDNPDERKLLSYGTRPSINAIDFNLALGHVFCGSMRYNHTNINQNNNATWLLKQKTHYTKRFDRLGNIKRFPN